MNFVKKIFQFGRIYWIKHTKCNHPQTSLSNKIGG